MNNALNDSANIHTIIYRNMQIDHQLIAVLSDNDALGGVLFFEHSDHSLLCSVYIKSCNAETAFRSVGNKLSEICCRDADSSKMVLIFYHDTTPLSHFTYFRA